MLEYFVVQNTLVQCSLLTVKPRGHNVFSFFLEALSCNYMLIL